jgi:hypothetical protein
MRVSPRRATRARPRGTGRVAHHRLLTSDGGWFVAARRRSSSTWSGGGRLRCTTTSPSWHGIRVDPADEIFANKLCTLLSRAEVRDLVDARALERAGLSLEAALRAGAMKDGGLTPAQLAWVLSEIRVPPDARIPGGVNASELAGYVRDLVGRLGAMSFPRS